MDNSLSQGAVAAFILAAVTIAMIAQGFVSLLEHNRRKLAMEVIKAAIEAGKEPPQQLYDQLSKADQAKAPWSEVVLFSALGFGFWIAYANAEADQRTAFLVVASVMTVSALGCLGIALMRPGRGNDDK
ncbi:hypothetical protein [Terricaulis sp.]|uniref:hypothetical protein n=1 Tax=Terricaulis sp. TaxID=2768686 RepID=UPI0037846915